MEAAYRTALAKGEVGITERKPVPILAEFIENRLTPWAKATFEEASPKTWTAWYRTQLRNIKAYSSLTSRKLDAITTERIADCVAHLQAKGLKPTSINSSLQVLRRVLRVAVEWGISPSAPNVKMLREAHQRDRVVTREEEARYLGAADELLADVATVLVDTGMRPEENSRLRWERISWASGQQDALHTHGKTAAARRIIPMSVRVRAIMERRWEAAKQPTEGWIWVADTKSGHIEPSTTKKLHQKALQLSGVSPFVLYSLRHTFLTRLGESGCDAWTLARIAGHSYIAMSARCVHPSEQAIMKAFERLHVPKRLPRGVQ